MCGTLRDTSWGKSKPCGSPILSGPAVAPNAAMIDPWAFAQPRPFLEQAPTFISPAYDSSLSLAPYISSLGPPSCPPVPHVPLS